MEQSAARGVVASVGESTPGSERAATLHPGTLGTGPCEGFQADRVTFHRLPLPMSCRETCKRKADVEDGRFMSERDAARTG